MRKSITSGLIVGASLVALPAFAGGPGPVIVQPAPVIVAPSIPAPRIIDWSGIYGGLSYSGTRGRLKDPAKVSTDFNKGSAPGAFVGYNFQNGGLVYGGELAYFGFSSSDLKGDSTTKVKNALDAKARLGYAFGRALVFGTVGYSTAHIDLAGNSQSFNGVSYGVGADYLVTDNIFLGAEYTKRNLSKNSYDADPSTFGIRVGYKF